MAVLLYLIFAMSSCFTAGTHGSIKVYEYNVSKYALEKIVEKVISENINLKIDNSKNIIVDVTDGRNDTVLDNYYSDVNKYITMYVKKNKFIFRYSGDKDFWDTSKISYLSLAYAYDENSNGGSEGNGSFRWYNSSLKKKLIAMFEEEFIEKVDKELGVKRGN